MRQNRLVVKVRQSRSVLTCNYVKVTTTSDTRMVGIRLGRDLCALHNRQLCITKALHKPRKRTPVHSLRNTCSQPNNLHQTLINPTRANHSGARERACGVRINSYFQQQLRQKFNVTNNCGPCTFPFILVFLSFFL